MRKGVGRRVRGNDEMTKEEPQRLWETAQPVGVERRRRESSVLSVRLPSHVFDELVWEAQRQGKGPATLARELIEDGLTRKEAAPLALLFERLAQRLRELQWKAPSVHFSETPFGSVIKPERSTLCTYFSAARTAALLGQPSTGPAEEVKVRVK
ncbi:MAG: hypothetical protein QN135_09885 [Armatimonadota bacterium]|nr:hypothetical protein [Armatimonadota bacterium]